MLCIDVGQAKMADALVGGEELELVEPPAGAVQVVPCVELEQWQLCAGKAREREVDGSVNRLRGGVLTAGLWHPLCEWHNATRELGARCELANELLGAAVVIRHVKGGQTSICVDS